MESSRRDLLNDMAEHRFILKNNQNTDYTPFSFTPKTGIELHKTGVLFLFPNLEGNIHLKANHKSHLIEQRQEPNIFGYLLTKSYQV